MLTVMRSAALVALAATLLTRPAVADVKADELFEAGRRLLEAGDLTGACAKFELSMRADPRAIGTLLNLALCDEKAGRVASAVKLFGEARDRAQEQGLASQQAAAEEHLATLTPLVPHLTLTFAEPAPPGTKVLIDEEVVALDRLAELPVNPGERAIVVTAPNRLPFETKVIAARAARLTVTVPALRRATEIRKVESSRRLTAFVVGGTGVAFGLAGVVTGLVARKQYKGQFTGKPDSPCSDAGVCSPEGYDKTKQARTYGTVGTIVGGLGVAAIAVGAYFYITAPKERTERAVAVVPALGPDELGLAAVGHF